MGVEHLLTITLFIYVLALSVKNGSGSTIENDESSFSGKFGSIVLNKIISGAPVKVGVEASQKITFSQDATCLTCSSPILKPICPQEINKISLKGASTAGFATCFPSINQNVSGASVQFDCGRTPENCLTAVTLVSTAGPTACGAYCDTVTYPQLLSSYIGVNIIDGTIFITNGVPATVPVTYIPCGPALPNPQPLIQTYQIQCIDASNVVSNVVTFNLSLPTCGAALGGVAIQCPIPDKTSTNV